MSKPTFSEMVSISNREVSKQKFGFSKPSSRPKIDVAENEEIPKQKFSFAKKLREFDEVKNQEKPKDNNRRIIKRLISKEVNPLDKNLYGYSPPRTSCFDYKVADAKNFQASRLEISMFSWDNLVEIYSDQDDKSENFDIIQLSDGTLHNCAMYVSKQLELRSDFIAQLYDFISESKLRVFIKRSCYPETIDKLMIFLFDYYMLVVENISEQGNIIRIIESAICLFNISDSKYHDLSILILNSDDETADGEHYFEFDPANSQEFMND